MLYYESTIESPQWTRIHATTSLTGILRRVENTIYMITIDKIFYVSIDQLLSSSASSRENIWKSFLTLNVGGNRQLGINVGKFQKSLLSIPYEDNAATKTTSNNMNQIKTKQNKSSTRMWCTG